MESRPIAQVERAITELTDTIARVLGADPRRVRVEAQPISPERWGIGGVAAAVKRRAEIEAHEARLR
jgi:phenylpyruvate tautomerase PptA (4-oxalocrotonate tautomerase family)